MLPSAEMRRDRVISLIKRNVWEVYSLTEVYNLKKKDAQTFTEPGFTHFISIFAMKHSLHMCILVSDNISRLLNIWSLYAVYNKSKSTQKIV